MSELSNKLREAVALRGRTTDVRQEYRLDPEEIAPLSGDFFGGKTRELDFGEWLLYFPRGQYPSSNEWRGSVPIALAGHEDLTHEGFMRVVKMIHARAFDRFAGEQAGEVATPPKIDARHYVHGGDYGEIFAASYPRTAARLEHVIQFVDAVYTHPLAPRQLELARSDRVYPMLGVLRLLRDFAPKLVEPPRRTKTQGDYLNDLTWPFGTVGLEP